MLTNLHWKLKTTYNKPSNDMSGGADLEENLSVKTMWEKYLLEIKGDKDTSELKYDSWYFCNNEKDANELVDLVKKGIKRGTASLLLFYELEKASVPQKGTHSVITNWEGIAQCVLKDINVYILPFKNVSDELAEIEGEGDKSLDYWRQVHIKYFSEELAEKGLVFNEDMFVVFEEFEVVYQ